MKRLRVHGLIKKVVKLRKYYLTKLGKAVIITELRVKELFIIPSPASIEVAIG